MDLLALLHAGAMSAAAAEELFDDLLEAFHESDGDVPFVDLVEMSDHEFTAYLHGAALEQLVRLRYGGWPGTCHRCVGPVDYQVGFWFHADAAGGQGAVGCVSCGHAIQDTIPWVAD